jgi:hypothetical protein
MKKFELVVKNGRVVVLHEIFEFNESEYKNFLEEIVKDKYNDKSIYYELEDVLIMTKGRKYYFSKYPSSDDNPQSVYDRPLQYFVDNEPDILIAAEIQKRFLDSVRTDYELSVPCQKTEGLIDRIGDYSFRCKIIE